MKRMFVSIPPKYGMTHEELEAFKKRVEETAYKAITEIGEYCEIRTDNDFCLTESAKAYYEYKGETTPLNRMYVVDCLKELCDSDYAVFITGWESSRECRALHYVAQELGIPILEVNGDEMKSNAPILQTFQAILQGESVRGACETVSAR